MNKMSKKDQKEKIRGKKMEEKIKVFKSESRLRGNEEELHE